MTNYIKTDVLDNVVELQLSVLVIQQGDYYVALCPTLNLSSYGDSIEDAKVGFDEVMKSYLDDCKKENTLHDDLVKNGWTFDIKNNKKAEPPAMVELDIPSGLLRTQYNQSWRVSIS